MRSMNNMNRRSSSAPATIDLTEVWKYIRKFYKLIILTTVVGLVLGIILSVVAYMRGEMSKKYEIKTSIAVSSQTEDGLFTMQSRNPNSADIHLAEDMVDSVIFVIKSDRTLEEAVDKLELIGISSKDIYDNLQLSQYLQTQIIDITLYWRNAEEGIRILEAINEVAPGILVDILKIGDVRVVNDPKAKYIIGGSVKASTWLIMMMLGLAVGIGIALLQMFFRPTLMSEKDVEQKLELKMLGHIPKDKYYLTGSAILLEDMSSLRREVNDNYVSVTHILKNVMDKQGAHMIYVTSTEDGEGKTSVTANMGIHLAEFEKRVLLLDMDLNSPTLGSKFIKDIKYEQSLNAVYQGDATMEEAIVHVSGHLHVLPMIHEEKDILMNEEMLDMIKMEAAKYDYTIIDTSAIGDSADILSLNRIADGAVFIVGYDHAPIAKIQNSLQRLERTEIPILGCVVNQGEV